MRSIPAIAAMAILLATAAVASGRTVRHSAAPHATAAHMTAASACPVGDPSHCPPGCRKSGAASAASLARPAVTQSQRASACPGVDPSSCPKSCTKTAASAAAHTSVRS